MLSFEVKELRKAISFFNGLFTEKEKTECFLYILPSKTQVTIVYKNENDLMLGKVLNLLTEPTCIKPLMIKVGDFTSLLSGLKGIKHINLDISSDEVLKVVVNDMVHNSFVYYNTTFSNTQIRSINNVNYKITCNDLENALIDIINVLKTSYYKDTECDFNKLIYMRLNNNIDFFATNGIAMTYKTAKSIEAHIDGEIVGVIELKDLMVISKWLSKTIVKELNISIDTNNGYIYINTNEQFISFYYQEDKSYIQAIDIYSGISTQLAKADKLITVNSDDLIRIIDKKLLKADTLIEFNKSLSQTVIFAKDLPYNQNNYIFSSTLIKNILLGTDEDFKASILAKYNNSMIVEFENGGITIINGIKSNIL